MFKNHSYRLNKLNSHFQGKGPFFTQFSDEIIAELIKNPEIHLRNGEVILPNFGIEHCYSRKVFVGGLPLDVTEREYQKFLSIKNVIQSGSVRFLNQKMLLKHSINSDL